MIRWVPEVPPTPGRGPLYAIDIERVQHCDQFGYLATVTTNIDEARRFETRGECELWCFPHAGRFVAVEHEWVERDS